MNFNIVNLLEILKHVSFVIFIITISKAKKVCLWHQIPSNSMYFISLISSVSRHYSASFKFLVDGLLLIKLFFIKSFRNYFQASLNWNEFWYVIYYQVESFLKDPSWCRKARPYLYSIIKHFCLLRHKE